LDSFLFYLSSHLFVTLCWLGGTSVAVLPGLTWGGFSHPKKGFATPQATPNENMNFLLPGIP